MKALSISQPWASVICSGLKDVENRTWQPAKAPRLHEDATGELLYDKLQLIFLELHRFNKTEEELVTWYDKWMYLFKNMAKLNARPVSFQEKIFDRLFDKAKIADLAPNEYRAYQKSEKMEYRYQKCGEGTQLYSPRYLIIRYGCFT